MDLAYLGQHEARYVQKQMHIVLSKTNNLLNLFLEENVTPDYLHYWLSKYHGPYTNEQGTVHYIVDTHKEIYESLANRIHHSLRRPLGVPLPALIRWLLGSDGFTKECDWRNIIAHNAGVPAPYERSDEDQIVNRGFDPARFLKEGTPILQDLKEDLELFLSWLDRDIDHYPVLEVEEPVYDPYNEQEFLRELEAQRNPHVIQLQAEQARLEKRAEFHREEAARIEDFYSTLAKDMSEELRQQAIDTETRMYDVCARQADLV